MQLNEILIIYSLFFSKPQGAAAVGWTSHMLLPTPELKHTNTQSTHGLTLHYTKSHTDVPLEMNLCNILFLSACECVRVQQEHTKRENVSECWTHADRGTDGDGIRTKDGDRGGREGRSDLAAGKTSPQRPSVRSLSSTNQHPKATHKHTYTHNTPQNHTDTSPHKQTRKTDSEKKLRRERGRETSMSVVVL